MEEALHQNWPCCNTSLPARGVLWGVFWWMFGQPQLRKGPWCRRWRGSAQVLGFTQLHWVPPGQLKTNGADHPSLHVCGTYGKVWCLSTSRGGRFPGVSSPPRSDGHVPAAHDAAARTPPALPCLQHAEQNTSQGSWGRGSSTDWPVPMAESKFPEVKGFYIHILHHLSMAPDWNSWFTQRSVNRDLACLVFLPCSLQVEDNSNNDNLFF